MNRVSTAALVAIAINLTWMTVRDLVTVPTAKAGDSYVGINDPVQCDFLTGRNCAVRVFVINK